jgi:GrpB-like predicted nucleotidyltransferase (UPF0157 family)
LLTKGDVGINVRGPAREFAAAVAFLRERCDIHQPQNWSEGFASFRDRDTELPLGLHVTVFGHPDDKFIARRDRLRADAGLIEQFNDLKRQHEGSEMTTDRRAKRRYIVQHLEA